MAAGIDAAVGYQFGTGTPYTDYGMTNDFADGIVNALNDSTPLYGLIKKGPAKDMVGLFMVGPMITGRDTGVSSVRAGMGGVAGGDMPDPTSALLRNWISYPKNFFARIKQDGDSLDRGKENGAFIGSLVLAEKTTMLNAKWDLNRQLHGDGSGRLVELVTPGTTNTGRVNSDLAGAASVNAQLKRLCDRNLENGMRVTAVSPTGTVRVLTASGNVTGLFVINTTATTFQVSLTVNGVAVDTSAGVTPWVPGDWIVRASSDIISSNMSSAYRADIMGIGGILNDVGCLDGIGAAGTSQQTGSLLSDASATASAAFFQGIACTTAEPYNRATIISSGTGTPRSLSFDLLQQLISDFEEANNGEPKLMLSAYRPYNEWAAIAEKDKRYNNTMELATGHKTLTFNGLPWWKDRMHVPGSISVLDTDLIEWHEVRPMGPVDYLGEGVWQRTSNKDAVWCTYKQTGNIVVTNGPRQRVGAKLVDLFT